MSSKLSRLLRLGSKLPFALRNLPQAGKLNVFSCAAGIGDELLATAVIRNFQHRSKSTVWVATRHPELFFLNPDISLIIPPEQTYFDVIALLRGKLHFLHYFNDHPGGIGDPVPESHLITLMCQHNGIDPSFQRHPVIHLSEQEVAAGKILQRQAVIQSSNFGSSFHMQNKEWYPQRMQAVVDELKGKFQFIQLGTDQDVPLRDALDLRGKTTVREAAAILGQSNFFVGLVGFLMHLARAVDCRSVIVYGGREHPLQSGYPENVNLYSEIACSPCWLWNVCDFGRKCMDSISPRDVIEGVDKIVSQQVERPSSIGQGQALDP